MAPRQWLSGLDGRKALVTGGSSGIGLRIAQRLSESGAAVAIGDIAEDRLATASRDQPALHPIRLDVRDRQSVAAAVNDCVDRLGGLDTVVHSAGIIRVKPLSEVTEEDWDLTLAVNLKGAFLVSQAAAPHLIGSGRGRIVAISSDAGLRGSPWIQAYAASKFGLIGLAQSLAAELAQHHTTVNCICPGAVPSTGMGRMLTSWKADLLGATETAVINQISSSYPLGRPVTEDDIADTALYLISDYASFVTGVAIEVSGGDHLGRISGMADPPPSPDPVR